MKSTAAKRNVPAKATSKASETPVMTVRACRWLTAGGAKGPAATVAPPPPPPVTTRCCAASASPKAAKFLRNSSSSYVVVVVVVVVVVRVDDSDQCDQVAIPIFIF